MSLRRLVRSFALTGLLFLVQPVPSFAQDAAAPATPTLVASSIAGPALVKAQKQIAAGKPQLALDTLRELDNLECSETDRYLRLRMTAAAHSALGNYLEAEPALAGMLNARLTPEHEKPKFFEGLLGLLRRRGDHAGAIALIKRHPEHAGDTTVHRQLMYSYYSSGKHAEAYREAMMLVQKAEGEGEVPEQADLNMAAVMCLEMEQPTCYVDALEQQLRHYPTPARWQDMLNRLSMGKVSRETSLEVLRLADATGHLRPEQFPQLVLHLLYFNQPNAAAALMARGLPKGAFPAGGDPAREQRFKEKAAELQAAAAGKESGYDLRYSATPADAVPALKKELAAALPADLPVLTLQLGIAQAAAGDKAAADATLLSVTGLPSIERVARLWSYHLRAKSAAAAKKKKK